MTAALTVGSFSTARFQLVIDYEQTYVLEEGPEYCLHDIPERKYCVNERAQSSNSR